MKKYIVFITAGKISTEELGKIILEKLGRKDLPKPNYGGLGNRDEKGGLDFSFLEIEDDGNGKIIITDSDNTVRQINTAILRGTLEKVGKKIPKNCEKVKGISYEEVEAFFVGIDGGITQLEVDDTGISVPVFDSWIEELNTMMEDLYYTLKYSEQ